MSGFSSQPDPDADAKKAQLRRQFDKQSKPVWLGAPFDAVYSAHGRVDVNHGYLEPPRGAATAGGWQFARRLNVAEGPNLPAAASQILSRGHERRESSAAVIFRSSARRSSAS